jgi:hypothetical protein
LFEFENAFDLNFNFGFKFKICSKENLQNLLPFFRAAQANLAHGNPCSPSRCCLHSHCFSFCAAQPTSGPSRRCGPAGTTPSSSSLDFAASCACRCLRPSVACAAAFWSLSHYLFTSHTEPPAPHRLPPPCVSSFYGNGQIETPPSAGRILFWTTCISASDPTKRELQFIYPLPRVHSHPQLPSSVPESLL